MLDDENDEYVDNSLNGLQLLPIFYLTYSYVQLLVATLDLLMRCFKSWSHNAHERLNISFNVKISINFTISFKKCVGYLLLTNIYFALNSYRLTFVYKIYRHWVAQSVEHPLRVREDWGSNTRAGSYQRLQKWYMNE